MKKITVDQEEFDRLFSILIDRYKDPDRFKIERESVKALSRLKMAAKFVADLEELKSDLETA